MITSLTSNHVDFTTILLTAIDHPNEEQIYLSGKIVLNKLYALEKEPLQFF
jgi:hypothetical protein